MDIIDLCSDSEDNINLCSDSEDTIFFCSDREDNLGSDDPNDGVDQSLVSFNTPFGQNNAEQPISFDDNDWLNSTQASSSYRPAVNRSATKRSSELDNFPAPMNIGSDMQNSNGQYRILPISLTSSTDRSHPFSLTGGNNIGNVCHRAPAVSAHRIYPLSSSSLMLHDSSHSNSQRVLTKNDDDDVYMYTDMPPSFPTSRSSLSGTRIKEDSTAKSNGFETSAANGIEMSSSTMSTGWKPRFNSNEKVKTDDDNGVHSHRIFPPSKPSWNSLNSVNGAEGLNGLDTQSHPNLENRLLGCDERAVYQEALQHISQEKKEEDLPEGVMSVSLLKHQKIALAWMVSKENSAHCPGGILADDQGLGKTISTIALVQKERVQQSKFMYPIHDSDHIKSVSLNLDEDEEVVMVTDMKDLKAEPSNKFATNLKLCASQPGAAVNRTIKTLKVEPKKKTRVSLPSSASTLRAATRPAAGTLVVCPASILKQWASEISAKVTENSKLSVLVYHGGSRTRDPTELTKYDVVVTTYTIVGHEVPKQDSDDDMEQKNSEMYGICPEFSVGNKRKLPNKTKRKAKNKKKPNNSDADLDGGPLARVRWFRVVLDEAQTIKNYQTKAARACCGLSAKRRWCLSGTPMQNTIDDLYSYFRFLKYEPYSAYSSFRSMIKYPIARGASQGYKKLQTVLKIVLLRRTKDTLIDGEPIIKLPPKTIQLKKINFTQEERYFYLALEEGSREKFKKFAAAGTIRQNYANILVLLLRLRQACDHPLLLKENQSNLIDDGVIEIAKQLPKETLINLLEKLEGRSAICSICEDPPEDAVVAACNHVFCHQCVLESLTSDENVCPLPFCRKKISAESVFSRPVLKLCISDELESYATSSCSTAADESSSICQSSYISSKIWAAIDILNSIFNTHALTGSDTIELSPREIAPSKAIVFSQWTGMLDLLELSLNSNLIQFRRLDGSMSLNMRERAVEEFKTDPEVRVMLMSLKAGNLGLNMIAACHVIMLDPWWNPYAEDQAVDRAHRIGQTRPVTVTRLTVKDTVEDRILALQEKKRKMVQSAFGDDKSGGNATRLTVEDLGYLFNV